MPTLGNSRSAQQTPLFDSYSQAAGTVPARVAFFNSRTQSANGPEITNMMAAGFLPNAAFTVFGMAFSVIDPDADDLNKLYKNYVARLIVGTKTYIEAPLEFFPAPGGIVSNFGTMTAAATNQQHTNGVPSQASIFALAPDYSIKIEAGERFEVNLVGTSVTAVDAVFVRCYLLGVYERNIEG